jgi:hypothetical protein
MSLSTWASRSAVNISVTWTRSAIPAGGGAGAEEIARLVDPRHALAAEREAVADLVPERPGVLPAARDQVTGAAQALEGEGLHRGGAGHLDGDDMVGPVERPVVVGASPWIGRAFSAG